MAHHLVLKGGTWHVRLDVPEYAQSHPDIQHRRVLTKSLKTGLRSLARELSLPVIANWKAIFRDAKAGASDNLPVATQNRTVSTLRVRAPKSLLIQLTRKNITPYDIVPSETAQGNFIRATATPSRLAEQGTLVAYKNFLCMHESSEKTNSTLLSRLSVILGFLKENNLDLNYASIAIFLRQSEFARNTLRGYLQAGTSYWHFLSELNHAQFNANSNPFKNQRIRGGRQALQRRAFEAHDVSALYLAALTSGDASLALCIKVAAYTGARIEEICQLKVCDLSSDSISISDSKTTAGIRTVPIHSALTSIIEGALVGPPETYLIETISHNKYGIRSDPLTKRFSRLKTRLGFNSQYVFHSIRKTFITLLERADVIEGIASDIVGHEKQTMTYGLYSQGASLSQMVEAIEKVNYPEMEAAQ